MRVFYPFWLSILFLFNMAQSQAQSVGDYRSAATGNWNSLATWERYSGTTWLAPTAAQGTPTTGMGNITIRSPHNVTLTTSVTADQLVVAAGAALTINSGITLTVANGTGNDLDVYGVLTNLGTSAFSNNTTVVMQSGAVINNAGTITVGGGSAQFNFLAGSTYNHSRNGGAIPVATWNAASTCMITGVTTSTPSNTSFAQRFGNFTWNCTAQTANANLAGRLNTVTGDFTVARTGTGSLRLANARNYTLAIAGDFNLSNGQLIFMNNAGATGNIQVAGDVNITGGTLNKGSGNGNFYFAGTTVQSFSKTGGTISNAIAFAVNNNAKVDFGTSVLDGSTATFTAAAGSTLITSHAAGLSSSGASGSVQVGGTRTYSNAANYQFNGSNTGTFTTTSNQVNNITFNRAAGVTIDRNFLVTGVLNLQSGMVTTGTYGITLGVTASISNAAASNYVNGKLSITYNATGSKTFPIGKGSAYRPITLQFLTLTGTSVVTAEQFETALTGTLPASTNLDASRYWSVSQTGASAFTYKVSLDGTGYTPSGTVVLLKKDGTTISSNTISTPNYTNATAFNTLNSQFALGSNCSASTTSNAGGNQTGPSTCGLTTVTLSANTPAYGTGLWTVVSGTGGSFAANTNPASAFSGIAGNTYQLRWTVTNGACIAQSTKNVTFNSLPSVSITNNSGGTELNCIRSAVNVTATGGSSYSWSNGLGTNAAQTFTNPGLYSVTATGSNGCTASASINITRNTTPPNASITNNSGTNELTCTTTSISLTATGGDSYNWSNGLGAGATKLITQPGIYSVTVTGSNGCISPAIISISQDTAKPAVAIQNNSNTTLLTCTQQQINVTATGADSYNWSNAMGTGAAKSIANPGTYSVTGTAVNGCSQSASITIAQDIALPTLTVTNNTGATQLTCLLPAISLTAASNGSIQWDHDLGNAATVTVQEAGTYQVTATGNNGCVRSSAVSITADVNPPAAPSAIVGPTDACPFTNSGLQISYSVTAVPGVTYAWSVPQGTTISSGQGTNIIRVLFGNDFPNANGYFNVSAIGANGCVSAPSSVEVVKNVPAIPADIQGPVNVCDYMGMVGTVTYSIAPVPYATSYTWRVGGRGITLVSGQGSTSVQISFDTSFVTGSIKVTANSNCGARAPRSLSISRKKPTSPVAINGPANVCSYINQAIPVTYTIATVSTASSYEWLLPVGMQLVSGQGTTSVQVLFDTSFRTSVLQVKSVNACGESGYRKLKLTRPVPGTPGVIAVETLSACPNRQYRYSIASMPSNASYLQWTVPDGASIVSGQGTTSVVVDMPSNAIAAFVTVVASNECTVGAPRRMLLRLPVCSGALRAENPVAKGTSTHAPDQKASSTIVYPNPTTQSFSIRGDFKSTDKIIVRIITADGRLVSQHTRSNAQLNHLGMDLKPGTYFVEIRCGNRTETIELVKQ